MKQILVIEDDKVLRETICEILLNDEYKISEAFNGEMGIQMIENETYDLVITDILMPQKDGLEVIMSLKKSGISTKIIAISGGGRVLAKDYLNIAKKFGCDEVIEKPFEINELIEKVKKVLNK